jgi:hypothetical protein
MAAGKVLIRVAVLALGGGVLASVANAALPCGRIACRDEAAASGLKNDAGRACLTSLISDCSAGLCGCTGGSPPCSCVCGDGLCGPSEDCGTCPQDCGTCPTTTSTTLPPIQCCVQSSPMGAFDTCTVETSAQCAAQGGIALGSGTCSPNPCPPSTSTSTTTTTTSSCPTATAPYCGAIGPGTCGGGIPACPPFVAICPSGMTCTGSGTTCGCTGEAIPCGDPRLSGITCNFCQWGTCPPGMTCGGVPKSGACGFDCACH